MLGGRDPLASYSGILSGILGGALLENSAGYLAGSTGGLLWWDTWRDPLGRDTYTGRDPRASHSGGILGGIHWRAALVWRDPLASCSGGILGGIYWRAALAGYWVGAWCRSIANADSNIKSINRRFKGMVACINPPMPRQRRLLFAKTQILKRSCRLTGVWPAVKGTITAFGYRCADRGRYCSFKPGKHTRCT